MYEYHRSFDAKEAAQISYMTTKGHGVDPANAWRGPKHATTLLHYIQQGMKSYGGFPTKALDPLTPAEKKVTMLNEFVALRAGKDKERLKNLHALFESAVNDDLHKGYSVNVDVLTCILADSLKGYDYCGAALRDAQTEESLQALEEEVMSIQQLQKALGIAEVPVTKILRPLYQHLAGQAFAEKLGLINVTGLVPRGDRSAIVLPSSKLLEVVQRWSDLIDTSKK